VRVLLFWYSYTRLQNFAIVDGPGILVWRLWRLWCEYGQFSNILCDLQLHTVCLPSSLQDVYQRTMFETNNSQHTPVV